MESSNTSRPANGGGGIESTNESKDAPLSQENMSGNKQARDTKTARPHTLAETVAIMNGVRLVGQTGCLTMASIILVGMVRSLSIDISVLIVSAMILTITNIMVRVRSIHIHASRQ